MMPDLKAGDYSAGMLKGVMAVTKYLMSSDYERAGMTGNRSSSSSDDDFMWIGAFESMYIHGKQEFINAVENINNEKPIKVSNDQYSLLYQNVYCS